MADILADVKRVSQNSRTAFTGNALKPNQWAICYNTDLPTVGAELVFKDVENLQVGQVATQAGDTGFSYYFMSLQDSSALGWNEVLTSNATDPDFAKVEAKLDSDGKTSADRLLSVTNSDTSEVLGYIDGEGRLQFGGLIVGDNAIMSPDEAIKIELTPTGDDKGWCVLGGQLSVGSLEDPRESVFGAGDSYPVPIAFHCDTANTTGLTITGATDITAILQSDNGSTTGLFGGTATGKYIIVGATQQFQGVKMKTTASGDVNMDNVKISSWRGAGDFFETEIMVTGASFPYTAYSNEIDQPAGDYQWRFGYNPRVPSTWVPVTLNINGTDYTYYWGRLELTGAITTDPVVEQIKLHTNRTEINADGVEEFFGLARYPRVLSAGLEKAVANSTKTPASENILYGTGDSAVFTFNEFSNTADDGFIFKQSIDSALDTSMPLLLNISYYVKGTQTGDVVFDINAYQVNDGFVFDGTETPDTYSVTDNITTSQNLIRRTVTLNLSIEKLVPSENITISINRNASSNASDTLNTNIVIEDISVVGYLWR